MKPLDYTELYNDYEGKWVAFRSEPTGSTEVVGSGRTLKEALDQAKRNGVEDPVLTSFPSFKYSYAL